MAEHQRLLLGFQPGEDGAQLPCAGRAGEHGVHVAVVVEVAGDARADLAEDLRVYAGGPLVDDEEGYAVLPHLTGYRSEDRMAGDAGAEEAVGFLDSDDEGVGLELVLREGLFGLAAVLGVDAAGDEIRDEQVGGEVVAVASELQHDVTLVVEVVEHLPDGALAPRFVDHEVEPSQR